MEDGPHGNQECCLVGPRLQIDFEKRTVASFGSCGCLSERFGSCLCSDSNKKGTERAVIKEVIPWGQAGGMINNPVSISESEP